ncbi:radical SAM protein [Desulfotomaculum sp. 1211_IL3151]|uniref:radical SAM protein n=1 Tax=Desulfotomaculum sp. 1211_IL3151 TaxID=3084055 RepID=UPI002FDA0E1F
MKPIFRAEQGAIVYYTAEGKRGYLLGQGLKSLFRWIKYGESDDVIQMLSQQGILQEEDKDKLHLLLKKCTKIESPPYSLVYPEQMQVELTTRCPLRCPQCYCDLNGKDLAKEVLFKFLRQAAWLDIPYISLSGGEPLIYPHLLETIAYIRDLGMISALATSGVGLQTNFLTDIKNAGLNDLYISLNGSTREIHGRSRDAYDETLAAMQLLKATNTTYYINWVARDDNVVDFPNVVKLAKELGAKQIVILVLKSDASYKSESYLKEESFCRLAGFLENYQDPGLPVIVESCFANLLAYLNRHKPPIKVGCEAGRLIMSLNANGQFSPCRHIPQLEENQSIQDYWYNSEVLQQLRNTINNLNQPCSDCKLQAFCHPCRGSSIKEQQQLAAGSQHCVVHKRV